LIRSALKSEKLYIFLLEIIQYNNINIILGYRTTVRFKIHYRPLPGQRIIVVGASAPLGAWQPEQGVQLKYKQQGKLIIIQSSIQMSKIKINVGANNRQFSI
jgi:hypothetical protein